MKISSTNVNIAVNAVAVAAEKIVLMRRKGSSPGKRLGKPARVRQRVSVNSVYKQLGPAYFRRAYRMSYQSFKRLAAKLHDGIVLASGKNMHSSNYIPNGRISTGVESCPENNSIILLQRPTFVGRPLYQDAINLYKLIMKSYSTNLEE
jgi:hypothetical protein